MVVIQPAHCHVKQHHIQLTSSEVAGMVAHNCILIPFSDKIYFFSPQKSYCLHTSEYYPSAHNDEVYSCTAGAPGGCCDEF